MRTIPNYRIEYLTLERAKELLADGIEEAFHDALHFAWGEWKKKHPKLIALPSGSFRAIGIHEMALEKLRELLADHPRVTIVDPKPGVRRAHFLIKDARGVVRMIAQSKKLDGQRRTSNIMTREARNFDAQRPIPDLPMGPRVTLGYRVVEGGTEIVTEGVYTIYKKAEWVFELCSDRGVEQLRIPAAAAAPKRRVTAKEGVARRRTKESASGDE